jgi:hypothetical protein
MAAGVQFPTGDRVKATAGCKGTSRNRILTVGSRGRYTCRAACQTPYQATRDDSPPAAYSCGNPGRPLPRLPSAAPLSWMESEQHSPRISCSVPRISRPDVMYPESAGRRALPVREILVRSPSVVRCADGVRGCPCVPAAGSPSARTYSGQRRRNQHRLAVFAHVRGHMEVQAGGYCKSSARDRRARSHGRGRGACWRRYVQ